MTSEQVNDGVHMTERMWADIAHYYDDIYAWKDYAGEATRISELVEQRSKSAGNELLDVACGTGEHIRYLQDRFTITGADLNLAMLDVARQKFPSTSFVEADMVTMNLSHRTEKRRGLAPTATVQASPTVDVTATMNAFQEDKLRQEIQQLQ